MQDLTTLLRDKDSLFPDFWELYNRHPYLTGEEVLAMSALSSPLNPESSISQAARLAGWGRRRTKANLIKAFKSLK